MPDNLSRAMRSKIMRSIRGRNTRPELQVRRLIYGMGYRYRLHVRELPGTPDIVLKKRRAAIFIHGCFWHLHERCSISHVPTASGWSEKLLANQRRDQEACTALRESGWKVMILWECQLKNPKKLQKQIEDFLGPVR